MTIGLTFFLIGLVGLVTVSIFFAWEFARGGRVGEPLRVQCDRVVAMLYRTFVFGEIPHVYRASFIAKLRRLILQGVHLLVVLLRAVERPLARMSHRMTYSERSFKNDGERTPSPFLNDIKRKEEDGKKPDNPV